MEIIETPIFTRQIQDLLSDDEYLKLQAALILRPDLGVVIPGGGGIRKLRWAVRGRGKRGGLRVIYYWAMSFEQVYMLTVYPKSEQQDLTPAQIKLLKRLVDEEFS